MGHTGRKYNHDLADQIAFPLPQSLDCESLPVPRGPSRGSQSVSDFSIENPDESTTNRPRALMYIQDQDLEAPCAMYLVSTRFRFLPQHDTRVLPGASEVSETQDISTRSNTNHSLPCGRPDCHPTIQIRLFNRNQSKSRCAAPHLHSLIQKMPRMESTHNEISLPKAQNGMPIPISRLDLDLRLRLLEHQKQGIGL
jgi:hypothetical protein